MTACLHQLLGEVDFAALFKWTEGSCHRQTNQPTRADTQFISTGKANRSRDSIAGSYPEKLHLLCGLEHALAVQQPR
jgi:hypothetical protein